MPTDATAVNDHARRLAEYLGRRVPERTYREYVRELQRGIARERYREIHDAAIRRIANTYLDVVDGYLDAD